MFVSVFLVGVGGFLGSIVRYLFIRFIESSYFPYGTLIVNGLGSFLLGLLMGSHVSDAAVLLFGTGFLGAYTTFSALKLECWRMLQNKQWGLLILYICTTYISGICLAFIGFSIASR